MITYLIGIFFIRIPSWIVREYYRSKDMYVSKDTAKHLRYVDGLKGDYEKRFNN